MNFYMIPNPALLENSKLVRLYPYQLWLAQWFTDNPELLSIARTIMREHNIQVILDNGAFEDELQGIEVYTDVIMELKPWCVVLPDLPDSSAELSLQTSNAAGSTLRSLGYRGQFMIAPQGADCESVIWAIRQIIANNEPSRNILGLGLCYKKWGTTEFARRKMVLDVIHHLPVPWRVHMLGARTMEKEDHKHFPFFSRIPRIIGMDTFKPTRQAYQEDYSYEPEDYDWKKEEHHRTPSDYVLLQKIYIFANRYGVNIFKDNTLLQEVTNELEQ